jgi:hypothetical protein
MQIIVRIIVKNDQSKYARNIYRVPKLAAEHAYYTLVSYRQEHPLRSHRLSQSAGSTLDHMSGFRWVGQYAARKARCNERDWVGRTFRLLAFAPAGSVTMVVQSHFILSQPKIGLKVCKKV